MVRQEPIFSKRVSAGKRTYFFDVHATKSEKDFFIVITESKRVSQPGQLGEQFERHHVRLYKEDFEKIADGLDEAIEAAENALRNANAHQP